MIPKRNFLVILFLSLFLGACNDIEQSKKENAVDIKSKTENITNKVLLRSEIVWEKLNPARGEQSPLAGTIWGDRNGREATGFLARFVDSFSSPPHIHNVTYRAVVIQGSIHNDDPKAEKMWMKPGSFWTQPQGESHITAAKGKENIALVEIDRGPYLVKPVEEAFDNGERPINIDFGNVVWLSSKEISWIDTESRVEISLLWKKDKSKGLFIKLPKSFKGTLKTDGTVMRAVVIKGELEYILPKNQELKTLDSGSYFGSTTKAIHALSNPKNEALLYIRTNGNIAINSL